MNETPAESLTDLGSPAGLVPMRLEGSERPGRVSVVHGARAEAFWLPRDSAVPEMALFQVRWDVNLLPVAGDWVAVASGELVRVAERRTSLFRPDPNGKDIQVLAANMDTVLVVLPVDRGLNVKSLERLAVMAWDSGAAPLVVLTKADGADDPRGVVAEAEAVAPGVPVLLTSAVNGTGIESLRAYMGSGTTSVMLGASGVGKTSLLNALEGHAEPVRGVGRSGQGRHTTTTRKLYRLRSGGVLLDLPGIRSLDLHASDEAVAETFPDITLLAQRCRFRDCAHSGDHGCAVEEAVASGQLAARRLRSWRAIQREKAYQSRRNDPAEMAAQRLQWKQATKASKARRRGR